MVMETLLLAEALIQVRAADCPARAQELLVAATKGLKAAEKEEWEIRVSKFRVSEKLDLLDKAKDRLRNVRRGCLEILNRHGVSAGV